MWLMRWFYLICLVDFVFVKGILESVDYLVKNGKRPKRSFYVAFGHDEEVRKPISTI